MSTMLDRLADPTRIIPSSRLGGGVFTVAICYVIPHPHDARVLLIPTDGGWILPGWSANRGGTLETASKWHVAEPVSQALQERLALDVPVLRCMGVGHDMDYFRWHLYETEPAPFGWLPPAGTRWVGRNELATLPVAIDAHRAILDQWFVERNDGELLARWPPWYRSGWWDEADTWIQERLDRQGLALTAPPEHIRLRERSCEIVLQTTGGPLRFKAVPEHFAFEGPLTSYLGQTFPGCVPTVIARDDTRHWVLRTEHADTSLLVAQWQADAEAHWADALRHYAQLQIASIPHIATFRALGVPSRPIEELPEKLHVMLEDLSTAGPIWGITDDYGRVVGSITEGLLDALRALAPSLAACCRELERLTNIPAETLVHRNLFPEYLTPAGDGYVLADWQDAAITHPFLDAACFLHSMARTIDHDPKLRDRLEDAYLDPWRPYAPRAELQRALALAKRVTWLQYATMYAAEVLPSMSAPWEKNWVLLYALQWLLDANPTPPPLASRSPSSSAQTITPPKRRSSRRGKRGSKGRGR